MIRTGLRGWLVVRQGLTRRIYGAADAGLVISFATYPLKTPAEKAVVSCNYGVVSYSVFDRSGVRVSSKRIVREVSEDRRTTSVIHSNMAVTCV